MVPAKLQSIGVVSVVQVTDIPWGDHLAQTYVAGLRVDGIGGVVLLEPLGGGLWEEIEYGLPLLQHFQWIVSSTESFHHPHGVKNTEEAPGSARACGPKWLERGEWEQEWEVGMGGGGMGMGGGRNGNGRREEWEWEAGGMGMGGGRNGNGRNGRNKKGREEVSGDYDNKIL